MEDVEVAVALGVCVVLVVAVAVAVHRRGGREAQSVKGYRQALDVLGQVAGGERRVGPRAAPGADAPMPSSGDRPVAWAHDGLEEPGTDDARRRSTAAAGEARGRRDHSLSVMERPARRLGASLAAVVVVLAVGGAAYVVVRTRHPTHRSAHAGSSSSPAHARTPSRSPTHAHATAGSSPPTTTRVPAQYTAVSSTSSSATYAPSASRYELTVGATTADCWMSVTSSTGTTVLAQTFTPGASSSLSLAGRATILLGAPRAAKLSIDGVPVVLPSGISGPYTVTLAPS
jgi:hypothetical protein